MYLRKAWYVAADAAELSRTPRRITVMGEHIAVYRTLAGAPVALEDACPHRKLPLSMGRLDGDQIECGYHGLKFDCTGTCTLVPGQGRIPPKAKVRSYPVADRYGLVWIWMGNPEEANLNDIFSVEHYDEPGWTISRGAPIDIACSYLLITDNLLDPSHVAWVHRSSFAAAGTDDTPIEINTQPDGVVASRWIYGQEVPPLYRPLVPFVGASDRLQHYEVRFPSHALTIAYFTPAGKGGPNKPQPDDAFVMHSYNFMTPVDERSSRYYYFQIRNVHPGDLAISKLMADGVRAAFMEDKAVLEACEAGIAKSASVPIDLAIDAAPKRFRRQLGTLIDREQNPNLAAQ